ncbi:MAG: amino acid adenylation domain-containing protein [Pseudomonadota bacterium]
MNTEELVARLYARGVRLAVKDGQLLLSAPDGALDAELLTLVRAQKPQILALVEKMDQAANTGVPAVRAEYADAYTAPASLAQQRMLFMEELAGGSSYYNIPLAFRIDGALDPEALARAFADLLGAHDVLRTVYGQGANPEQGATQIVRARAPFELARHDVTGQSDPQAALADLLAAHADYRFDLARDIPVRAALIALGPLQHVLSINVHHIAADGHSARRMLADLSAAYRRQQVAPAAPAAPARGWQYADYVHWQERWAKSAQFEQAQSYWLAALAGAPQVHAIMPDFQRPAVQSVVGSHLRQPLPAALVEATAGVARGAGTTPFVIYQAVFAALLARYSGESDIVFGTAAANRQPLEFNDAVGLFVNTLVLRFGIEEGASFSTLLEQAKSVSAGAFRHQQYPFDTLVEQLQPARSLAYNPLVQIMLVMQDEGAELALEGATVHSCEQQQAVSKFDIALHVRVKGPSVVLDWEYNTSLFTAATIERMSGHFQQLLQACLGDANCAPDAIALHGDDGDAAAAPDLAGEAGEPVCVHRLFEQLALRQPQALALREGEASLCYGELDARAEQVARHLAAAGAGAGTPVGVCMEKSMALVVAMLAIYKVGATYVPLDPHYPAQRLEFMLRDAGVALLLAAAEGERADALDVPLTRLYLGRLLAEPIETPYPACAQPQLGAYLIYTSGSTGAPKGVLVTHANLYYSLHANRGVSGFGAQDSIPTIGSQAFGVSLLEIMLPLTSGGAAVLVTKAQVVDVEELVRASAAVTVLHAVPSLMRQWLDVVENVEAQGRALYPQLRLLLVGGESVPDTLLRRIKAWRPAVRLLAMYGMTESAIICSSYEAQLTDHAPAHYCIGKPYRHARFHVLGREGQQQPVGVPGELHIGGLSVASHYVGQEQMTAERFLASPFHPGERIYRTGDRVRRLVDGNFEFLGRVDHQVSLRGARIELGELETLANGVAGVTQAVAHVAGEQGMLVLYYTSSAPAEAQADIADAARAALAERLPDYMRPSLIQHLDAFPLNPNGKVDRKKLPAPTAVDAIVAPNGDIERRVLALCHALLGREDFGVTANFFEVGGHSLLAAKLVTKIRASFEISFPLTALYSSPTVRACALIVEGALKEKFAASLVRAADLDTEAGDELIL